MNSSRVWENVHPTSIERLRGIEIQSQFLPNDHINQSTFVFVGNRLGSISAVFDFRPIINLLTIPGESLWGIYNTRDIVESATYRSAVLIPGNSYNSVIDNIKLIEDQYQFEQSFGWSRVWVKFKLVHRKQSPLVKLWSKMWLIGW